MGSLWEGVEAICRRLAAAGWGELLARHGLNLDADDLQGELGRLLPDVDRAVPGFEDLIPGPIRGVTPGVPSRSLLYHALASPEVTCDADGKPFAEAAFPKLHELDAIENYVYSAAAAMLSALQARAGGGRLAIVPFALEYRPAASTPHGRYADLCFSRTGVARVGTAPHGYLPAARGFGPDAGDGSRVRVLPARWAAFVAVQRTSDAAALLGAAFVQDGDDERRFWVPLHKLFDGDECLADVPHLELIFDVRHRNEKLRRIHLAFAAGEFGAFIGEPDISESPFQFDDRIAEVEPCGASRLVVPVTHDCVVKAAEFGGKTLTLRTPATPPSGIFWSSLKIRAEEEALNGNIRRAPAFVHVRRRVDGANEFDLNLEAELVKTVTAGGYDAVHFLDFTGDGAVRAHCGALAALLPDSPSSYSVVAAPDFVPHTRQRELSVWSRQRLPESLRKTLWAVDPDVLADTRLPANLALPPEIATFPPDDDTVTALLCVPPDHDVPPSPEGVPTRHAAGTPPAEGGRMTALPDASAGVLAPGWDVSLARTNDVQHLATFGLGSPFPEDAKLCAALSSFWAAAAPDASRTFSPHDMGEGGGWPTILPLTDDEIGADVPLDGAPGPLREVWPWDGIPGPRLIADERKRRRVEYTRLAYGDYVLSGLERKFRFDAFKNMDAPEYERRALAMARVYRAVGVAMDSPIKTTEDLDALFAAKSQWTVLSFLRFDVAARDAKSPEAQELYAAEKAAGGALSGIAYRFVVYRRGPSEPHPTNPALCRVPLNEETLFWADGLSLLTRRRDAGANDWKAV